MELIKRTKMVPAKTGKKSLHRFGLFLCSYCGKEVEKQLSNGKRDKSCGCFRPKRHGQCRTRLYNVWSNMKARCYNPKNNRFYCYGKRGIKVCDEWRGSYLKFMKWAMENRYEKSLQIDRKNNNKGYSPENCRFVTPTENIHNQSTTKLNFKAVSLIRRQYSVGNISQMELAKKYNISKSSVWYIVNNIYWKQEVKK